MRSVRRLWRGGSTALPLSNQNKMKTTAKTPASSALYFVDGMPMRVYPVEPGAVNVYQFDSIAMKGMDGKSAYQTAVEGGYTGTEAEFAALLANIGPNTITQYTSLLPEKSIASMAATEPLSDIVRDVFWNTLDTVNPYDVSLVVGYSDNDKLIYFWYLYQKLGSYIGAMDNDIFQDYFNEVSSHYYEGNTALNYVLNSNNRRGNMDIMAHTIIPPSKYYRLILGKDQNALIWYANVAPIFKYTGIAGYVSFGLIYESTLGWTYDGHSAPKIRSSLGMVNEGVPTEDNNVCDSGHIAILLHPIDLKFNPK